MGIRTLILRFGFLDQFQAKPPLQVALRGQELRFGSFRSLKGALNVVNHHQGSVLLLALSEITTSGGFRSKARPLE